jgi:transposase
MSPFRPIDRDTSYLFPPSIDDWLPEQHLARFVVDIVQQLDLRELEQDYRGAGSAPFHPALLLAVLVYGYATGVFSSRKLERATYDSVAFRYVAANEHPDHDTLNSFRKRFLPQIEKLMVQVLMMARLSGVLKLGNIALDGTKIKANASKHSALSFGHIEKLEQQLRQEVAHLSKLAESANRADVPDGMDLPEEIARREERLKAIGEAREKLEARAKARFAKEQAEHQAKLEAREAQAKKSGKKPGGKPPVPPQSGPNAKDQINLTDEESRIMPVSSGGFDQCYNSQAAVDMDTMLIVQTHVVQEPNDKQQVVPLLRQLSAMPEELGKVSALVADTGYCSEANVTACCNHGVEPFIAGAREHHHQNPLERFAEPAPLPADATPMEAMRHRLKTKTGKALYAKRKCTVEPVFGIIKSVLGFRQFLMRGLDNVQGELNLVAMAWNLKRMFVMTMT